MPPCSSSKANESGYLVRIAPNEVACSDPEAIKVTALARLLPKHVLNRLDYLRHQNRFHQGTDPSLRLTSKAHSIRPITTMLGSHRTTDTSVISLHVTNKIIRSAGASSAMFTRCPASLNPKSSDSCTQLFCETMRDFARQKSLVDLCLWVNM